MRIEQMAASHYLPLWLQYLSNSIAIYVIFLSFHASKGVDDSYKKCSTVESCGKFHNIGYPFWGENWRPSYCGDPTFQLICPGNDSNAHPILNIPSDSLYYKILDMNYSTMTMQLLELDPEHPDRCSTPFSNSSSLSDTLFEYSQRVENISLFYHCKRLDMVVENITCSDDADKGKTSYYWVNNGSRDELKKACDQHVEVPVLGKDSLEQGKGTLQSVLQQGFQVNFSKVLLGECSSCQKSGGVCGSSGNYAFACFRKSGFSQLKVTIVSVSSALSLVVLIVLLLILIKRRTTRMARMAIFWKERTENQNVEAFLKFYGSLAPKRYTYSSIKKITNSFKDKLGEGGYAIVYKGKLSDGRLVAVKLFKQLKGNGQDFINEVASIGKTNHVNIVALLGFCFETNKRALIYEFMPNGSLEKFTFHRDSSFSLPWEMLFNIAEGIAKGLDYLHQGCNERILHFDIKPHNILLDKQFRPKISDFGLARLCPQQESSISMLEARGTIGYIAPEVFCRSFGGVSHKSDVYSYGMMILDLVCGRTNTCGGDAQSSSSEMYFPHWIYKRLEVEEVKIDEIMNDEEQYLQRKMILVSLWCIQMDPSNRPSMSQVVDMLNGCVESISMPPKPYLFSPPRSVSFPSSKTLP